MRGGRLVCGVLYVALICGVAAGPARAGEAGLALHCMNTTSGATWELPVDLARKTVDRVPARITPRIIAWKDKTLRYYEFDRGSGTLEMHVASSTGGFILLDRCVLK